LPILAVTAAVGVFAARPDRRSRLAAAGVGAVTATAGGLAVTNVSGVALHDALYLVPGVAGMRSIGRIALVLAFPLGLATAAGIESVATHAAARWGRLAGRLLAAALLALLLIDQWLVGVGEEAWARFRFPVAESAARRDRLAEAIRQHPRPTLVYVFPPAGSDLEGWYAVQVDAAAAAQAVGVPAVNGWSGYTPRGWGYFTDHTGLWRWLTEANGVPAGDLDGLVVIGEPSTPGDPAVEGDLRRRCPPIPLPRQVSD
jgi:hypothetical protein